MYYFSWKTSDTEESISNKHSSRGAFTVYLIQPNNKPPIREDNYNGNGVFGGIDAYAWLARENLGIIGHDKDIRLAGIIHAFGCYKDKYTGELWDKNGRFPGSSSHGKSNKKLEEYGKSPDQLIRAGLWIPHIPEQKYPLKFSRNKNARYEDLKPAEICDYQGYLYLNDSGVSNEHRLCYDYQGGVKKGPHKHLSGNMEYLWGNCSNITGKCTGLKGYISELIGDVTKLNGECTTIEGDISQLKGDCSNISGDCSNIQGNVTKLEGDCSKINGDVSALRGNCSALTGDINGLKGDCSGISGDVSDLTGDLSGLCGNASRLSGDCSGISADLDLIEIDDRHARPEIAFWTTDDYDLEISEQLYHYIHDNETLIKVSGQHKDLRGNCSELVGDCTNVHGLCVAALRGDCSNLTGDCTGLYGDCSNLAGDCSGLQGNCSNLTGDCSGLDGYCSHLEGNCSNLSGTCTKLIGDCSKLKGDCSGLQGNCSWSYGDCTGLRGNFSDLENNLDLITDRQEYLNSITDENFTQWPGIIL